MRIDGLCKQFIEMKKTLENTTEKTLRERTLESKVAQLEKELKDEKLKSLAYSTMIDVAEEECRTRWGNNRRYNAIKKGSGTPLSLK